MEENDSAFELIVSRMMLRISFSVPTFFGGTFLNIRSRKTLLIIDGIDNIIQKPDNYIPQTCRIPISPFLPEPPLSGISAALVRMSDNIDEEFRQEITRRVLLAFTDENFTFSDKKVSSVIHKSPVMDVDIKVVTGSYLIGEDEELEWELIEYEHEELTKSYFVEFEDCDYSVVSSYVKVPCGDRGYLRAIGYSAEDVMEAKVCSICCDELRCSDDYIVNANVLRMPCTHLFHNRCILSWLRRNDASTCPLCRTTIPLYL